MISKIRAMLRPVKFAYYNRFLKECSGVVHVGANSGQERERYDSFGLKVVWVEPIPDVFAQLQRNIKPFPKQRALEALVTDEDGKEYQFNIADNRGESSSILDLKGHKDIFPDVNFVATIALKSVTLPTLFAREKVNPKDYQALIMDTQGSELLVLKGALPILKNFKYVKTEVADFEAYAGCCQVRDIEAFMTANGYREHARKRSTGRDKRGGYYDITYVRND